MKHSLLLLAAAFVTLCAASKVPVKETVTPASDGRITWIARTLVTDGDVSFDWSGSRCRIRFQGDYLALRQGILQPLDRPRAGPRGRQDRYRHGKGHAHRPGR